MSGLDPFTWLAGVLERIVSGAVKINDLERLLSWAWQAECDGVEAVAHDAERQASPV